MEIEGRHYFVSAQTICNFIYLFDSLEEPFSALDLAKKIETTKGYWLDLSIVCFFLNKLCTQKGEAFLYDLNAIKRAIALSIEEDYFEVKKAMEKITKVIRESLPMQVLEKDLEAFVEYSMGPCEDNIYPGFKQMDMRFLKEKAFAVATKTELFIQSLFKQQSGKTENT